MTIARMYIVDAHSSGAYHIVTRCVRRAWLCGRDALTGRDFSHRKRWIEERIFTLAESFSIAVYAYAIMSNHVHRMVQTNPDASRQGDAAECCGVGSMSHAVATNLTKHGGSGLKQQPATTRWLPSIASDWAA